MLECAYSDEICARKPARAPAARRTARRAAASPPKKEDLHAPVCTLCTPGSWQWRLCKYIIPMQRDISQIYVKTFQQWPLYKTFRQSLVASSSTIAIIFALNAILFFFKCLFEGTLDTGTVLNKSIRHLFMYSKTLRCRLDKFGLFIFSTKN